MKSAKMSGLRRKQTYDEMINYLHYGQEVVKYPNRKAKQLRESPYMTQLDGEDLDQQHERILNQQKRQLITQQVSAQTGRSQAEQHIQNGVQRNGGNPQQPVVAEPVFHEVDDDDEGGPGDDPTMPQHVGNEVAVPQRNAWAIANQFMNNAEGAVANSHLAIRDAFNAARHVGRPLGLGIQVTAAALGVLGGAAAGLTTGVVEHFVRQRQRQVLNLEDLPEEDDTELNIDYFEATGRAIHNARTRAPMRSFFALENQAPALEEQASSSTSRQTQPAASSASRPVAKNHRGEPMDEPPRPVAGPNRRVGRRAIPVTEG